MSYLLTMCAEKGKPWVRYQTLPASLQGHRVNIVYHEVWVNQQEMVRVISGHYHCVRCGIMGTENTLKFYPCTPVS